MEIPEGYCQCGCGEKTKIAVETNRGKGLKKGRPLRFLHTHHARVPLKVRFWSKVAQRGPDDCWPWIGSTGRYGYGQLMISEYGAGGKKSPQKAHRISWELSHGPIPPGMHVLHRCDNPPCVNPAHLFVGNQRDNMRDASSNGRIRGTFALGGGRN